MSKIQIAAVFYPPCIFHNLLIYKLRQFLCVTFTFFIICSVGNRALGQTNSSNKFVRTKPLFRDFMGINGHTIMFQPELYAPVCQLVRDYHPVEWDMGPDSDYKLDFPFARNRVNWDQVYGSWQRAGFRTNACLMFETLSPEAWKDVERDARNYGKRFAESFGPSSSQNLVEAVEIGNEPGKYSDALYRRVFESMAAGLREADPKLKIATCNVNVGKSGDYHKSVDCVAGLETIYDVLNIHSYATLEPWPTWKRSYPEDSKLPSFTRDVAELIDWRDEHAASKSIWLTEFGWDSSTMSASSEGEFARWQGNTDLEQAQWLVRGFLWFAARDVDRAYLYFFNDDDEPKLHGSSGITRKYQPKASYYAVGHLYHTLGDYRFARVVYDQTDKATVYEFTHASSLTKKIWIAWSPTGDGSQTEIELPFSGMNCIDCQAMPTTFDSTGSQSLPHVQNNQITIEVSESPLYLIIESLAEH